jgi:hypothetical protein
MFLINEQEFSLLLKEQSNAAYWETHSAQARFENLEPIAPQVPVAVFPVHTKVFVCMFMSACHSTYTQVLMSPCNHSRDSLAMRHLYPHGDFM